MSKQLSFNNKAREAILRGVEQLASAVKATLGPRGRNVVIERKWGPPLITKDGVTVAREIELKDPYEDMGAEMVKEVASKTNDMAGDGTTTATILAESMYKAGLKAMAGGVNPVKIKRGIDCAIEKALELIEGMSIPCTEPEDIKQVATIAANGDTHIGDVITEGLTTIGEEGVISVQEGVGIKTELKFTEGMAFDRGYISPYFVTDPAKMEARLTNPYVLICDFPIAGPAFVNLLGQVAQTGRPIVIIAENIIGAALSTLIANKVQGRLSSCCVKAPGVGNIRKNLLEDIATLVGATVVSEDLGIKLQDVTLQHLGQARSIRVTKDETTIVDGAGDSVSLEARREQLRLEIEEVESDYDKTKLQERLAKLSSGIAVIEVGASTEIEMKEKRDRIEDSLNATQAAMQEGTVSGGGIALLRASQALKKALVEDIAIEGGTEVGWKVVIEAMQEPVKQIAYNAGEVGEAIVSEVLRLTEVFGYDAERGQCSNMREAGIVDPAKVVRLALQNAASVAGLMLTTQVLVADDPGEEEKYQGQMGGGR